MAAKAIKNKSTVLLLLILVFALVLRIIFFTGISSSDSLYYSEFANKISRHEPFITGGNGQHLALRLGIVFPVALLYSIFGANEFTSNIIPLLFSLFSVILIYKFGKFLFDERTGLLSALLLSFFPLDIIFGTSLLGDVPAAFFMALSVYLFLKAEKNGNSRSSIFSGISLGVAYLIREMSVLMALFFIFYAIYNRKIKNIYFFVPLGFLLVALIEFLYFWHATGNPFYRYSIVSGIHNEFLLTDPKYQRGNFPISLLYFPYLILRDYLSRFFSLFIFMSGFYCFTHRKKSGYILLLWFVPLLLYICFGSTSLSRYILFPVDLRFLLMVSFPGLMMLAYFLSDESKIMKKLAMPCILAFLLLTSIGFVHLSGYRNFLDKEKAIHSYAQSLPPKPVYTDESTFRVLNYLDGYKNDNLKSFNYYEFLNPGKNSAMNLSNLKNSYVVIYWGRINFNLNAGKNIKYPDEIFHIPKRWVLKKEIGAGADKTQIYFAE